MSILITAATSAAAHKLKNKLNSPDVILGDFNDLPAFMGLIKLPATTSASYQHEMLALCLDRGITGLYVLTGQEMDLLKESLQLFKEYNIDIIDGQTEI